MNRYLFTPGPVPRSEKATRAESAPLMSHREPQFYRLLAGIQSKLQALLDTKQPIVLLPSSGTGSLECMAVNLLRPGTKTLSVSCGSFGDRFREIAERTGAAITGVDVPWGEAMTAGILAKALADNPGTEVVLLTHNETSTGVANDLEKVLEPIRAMPNAPLVLVDGVSALGTLHCYPEDWGIDGIGSASQKGLMTPPGLGLVWLSARAWERLDTATTCPSYYWDLKLHKKQLLAKNPQNPYTPPVSLFYVLDDALDDILGTDPDGMASARENWFATRRRFADALCAGFEAMGLDLLVKKSEIRSPGVTAVRLEGADDARKELRAMGVEFAGGQGALKGQIFRTAHYTDMGWPELSLLLGCVWSVTKKGNLASAFEKALAAWKA